MIERGHACKVSPARSALAAHAYRREGVTEVVANVCAQFGGRVHQVWCKPPALLLDTQEAWLAEFREALARPQCLIHAVEGACNDTLAHAAVLLRDQAAHESAKAVEEPQLHH